MTLETIMNIEALKTFLVVAEVKNFTKAAQQLFVVQSTITNRIKELEKEIGQPLFDNLSIYNRKDRLIFICF